MRKLTLGGFGARPVLEKRVFDVVDVDIRRSRSYVGCVTVRTDIVGRSADDPVRRRRRLAELTGGRTELSEALEFYDSLPPVQIDELLGSWRGSGLDTGHPFDGVLEAMGWHGKRFDSPDEVHPLVMVDRAERLFCLNPAFVPVSLLVRFSRLLHNPLVQRLFRLFGKLFRTSAPRARLRMTGYRGVITATMCYDDKPIHDVFRKVDDDTVLGAMDARGVSAPLLFVLYRERPAG